jgi:hypothetical protein
MVWAGKVGRTWSINSESLLHINICAADISWKVITEQMKGYI